MSEFSEAVYTAVRRIPRGCVATYGQVAEAIGRPRAARYVGFALHNNPNPGMGDHATPCHRVVFKNGSLAPGFGFGGPEVQRRMLEAEGVTFVYESHVDLARHRVKTLLER